MIGTQFTWFLMVCLGTGADSAQPTFLPGQDPKPSGSLWDKRIDEQQVFQVEMKHQQDSHNSFALRVGKGGQIYSLRGPFGESMPPSWRGGADTSPWNDEVWQFVAVCTKYNGLKSLRIGKLPAETTVRFKTSPYENSFFVHNSGAYIPGNSSIQSLYCPLLASSTSADGRCYRTLNWGLVPQVKTMHRSPLLYYGQTRDVGDGVIELTWVVHNVSVRDDVVFDHLNAPWGRAHVQGGVEGLANPASQLVPKLRRGSCDSQIPSGSGDVRVVSQLSCCQSQGQS